MLTTTAFEPGTLQTSDGVEMPLVGLGADATVTGIHTRWTLTQTYRNPTDTAVEVVYVFPLPGRFATGEFTFISGGRRIVGELRERGEARERYNDAVAAGQTAALVEEDRPEVFTVTLGNVAAGAEAEIELVLTGDAPVVAGKADLRLPTVVGERYTDGERTGTAHGTGTAADTHTTPDASRVTPPMTDNTAIPYAITVAVDSTDKPDVPDGFTVTGTAGSWTVRSGGDHTASGDIHVRWAAPRSGTPTAVARRDDNGVTVAVTLASDVAVGDTPRDVVLLIDRSGSMGGLSDRSGSPMEIARRAVARLVDSLNDNDRLAVIAFDHTTDTAWEGLRPATDANRFEAVTFCSKLDARGGTDIAGALSRVDTTFDSVGGRDRIVVLVTDALVSGEDHTLRHAPGGVTFHSVCIGGRGNLGLLGRVADATGGTAVAVEAGAELDRTLDTLRRLVAPPVWRDAKVLVDGEPVSEATPRRADVHSGVVAVLSGRSAQLPERVTVTATGRDGQLQRWDVPVTESTNPAIDGTWARGRVRDLEDLKVLGGDDAPTSEQIVELSLRHKVLCRFTAFVAVDEEGGEVAEPATRTLNQPAGASMLRGGSYAASASLGRVAGSVSLNSVRASNNTAGGGYTVDKSLTSSLNGWDTTQPTGIGGEWGSRGSTSTNPLLSTHIALESLEDLKSELEGHVDAIVGDNVDHSGRTAELSALAMRLTMHGASPELTAAVMELALAIRVASGRGDVLAAAEKVKGLLEEHTPGAGAPHTTGRFWEEPPGQRSQLG